jgi:hypothetical protein
MKRELSRSYGSSGVMSTRRPCWSNRSACSGVWDMTTPTPHLLPPRRWIGSYVLPAKKAVRRAEGIETGDVVPVTLRIIEQ